MQIDVVWHAESCLRTVTECKHEAPKCERKLDNGLH